MRRTNSGLALVASAFMLSACVTTNSGRDLGYALQETLGAPASFLVGAVRQAEKDPAQAIYDLTGRAASEAGRVVNGVTHMATGHRYEAEFGSAKIHPLADNHVVKAAGWGVVFAPIAPWSYVEGVAGGVVLGAGAEVLKKKK